MGNEYGLQYIMDGTGNYYRVNGNDQLVVAGRKEEASVFSMYEANQRIGGGKKSKFYITIPVEDDEQTIAPDFPKVISIVDKTEVTVATETTVQEPEKENLEDRSKAVSVSKDSGEAGYDISNMDWMDYMNLFCYLVASAKNYQESMAEEHSKVEKEICDLLHYVELYDLSEAESMHAVELIKEARMRRRDIKDEIMRVELFKRSIGTSANVSKAKGCITELKKLETRIYHPREHSELFVGMDSRKTDRTLMKAEQENEEMPPYEEEEPEQEACMEYCRKETIFDDRQNDWTEMAVQQYNFFTNIQQYMINVEIRLDELDQSIEETLMSMEDTNYNITQGYKAYKELKELRNERKKLLEEFEQLQMMVGCFDCNAMANAYGYIVENSIGVNVGDEVDGLQN